LLLGTLAPVLVVGQQTPSIYTAEIDGIVHPVAAQHVQDVLNRADAAGASLVVITLRTPGGLVDSTREINNAILRAKTPVAVFVGPSGNRAASAGFLITIAADVAAMAPGTHIGAAHPVAGNGEKVDDTMARKMASDVAAYARTLATQRKRNVALVEQAVTESRSFTDQEALAATPPLIDLVANDVPDLVRKLDKRVITRFDGRTETLHTSGAATTFVGMTWPQRVLSGVAHPQVAYLLLTLGTLGLTIELWSPGAILPGVAGGICLLLAFFAFQVLPVSYAAILLILFGLALLVLEVKVTSFGLLAIGGIVSLFFGSMMLVDSPLPEMQVGLRLVIPITLGIAFVVLFLTRLAVRSQRAAPVTGMSAMIGESGEALTAIDSGRTGSIRTRGEIWSATSDQPIEQGRSVTVTGITGLVLHVAPARHPEPGSANPEPLISEARIPDAVPSPDSRVSSPSVESNRV
jgi:membrane-bound serine protease (ClpP class)